MPQPNDPAAAASVSGPGKYAKRTDSGPAQKLQSLPNAKYGENKTYQADQRSAPLAQSPGLSAKAATPASGGGSPFQDNPSAGGVVPFSAPTQRPGEPVTAGAALGAGPGTEALGIAPHQIEQQDVGKLQNWLAVLEATANYPDSLPGARMLVNSLKSQIQQ